MQLQSWKSCHVVQCGFARFGRRYLLLQQFWIVHRPLFVQGEYSVEVVKEAEAAAVEGEAVDFPEVDADRKHEATLRDAVAEEVLVPVVGAPMTGGVFDRFPQSSGRSLRSPMCPLWLIIGKAAQREMRAKLRADDHDAFAAQEERRSSW